ncbi:MAG: PQQ-binding-like beta-propeller repeat protein [Thermoguttaceae bacterium]|jgi:outer membrane protein assembly factor BamB
MRSLSCILAGLSGLSLLAGTLASAATWDDTQMARRIVDTAGVSRGVCSLPRCDDGALAIHLAESGFLVHGMDAAETHVAEVRKAARAAGILGRTFYVERGSPASIPFADDYVNLLVVADATDENLAAIPLDEVLRVLAPGRGRALVGLAPATPGKLRHEKLSQWLKQCPAARSRVVEGESGLWALVSKSPKAGAVAWTHRLFNPSNNPVSGDTACAWPLMTQWLGKPYLAQQPLMLVAGGRLASVRPDWNRAVLEVLDAHNGVLLWRRKLPDASVATRTSGMVLLPDALYLAEGPNVLVFEPATGSKKGQIPCEQLGQQVKWLAIEAGRLCVMAGSAEEALFASQTWKVFGDAPRNFGKCQSLGAYDLSAGKWLWTHREEAESLDESLVGLCNGRLYYYVTGRHAACRETTTGNVLWTNAKVVEKLKPPPGNIDTRGHLGALICGGKFLAFHRTNAGTAICSATNGEPLWTIKATSLLFFNDLLIRKGGDNWGNPAVFEAATGTPAKNWPKMNFGSGCGTFTLTPNLLCGQFGLTYDFKVGKDLDLLTGNGPLAHKTPCLAGTFVGEGMLLFGSAACTCPYTVRGTIVQSPAPTEATPTPSQSSKQDTPRTSFPVQPPAVDAADWPAFRATVARGNASRAKVSMRPAIRWTWRPSPGIAAAAEVDPLDSRHEPTQATAAGTLVFATETDGSITALDLATGRVRWTFPTAGRLFAPPTIADGRCFIGSGDGQLYCVEANTGRPLWRYRVAPADRRIMVYGDLLSTWPITGGALVHEGVVYAVAGILDGDGTHVVALDAASGTLRWRQDAAGHLDSRRRTGIAGVGCPAIGSGRLWLRRDSFDLATGEVRPYAGLKKHPYYEMNNNVLERYTGVFANRFLVTGGRRSFEEQFAADNERGNENVSMMELTEQGTGKSPAVTPWQFCRNMPAWDDHNLVALPMAHYHWSADGKQPPCVREEDLVCWDTPRAVAELRKTIDVAMKDPNSPYRQFLMNRGLWGKELDKRKGDQFQAPQQVWRREKPRYIAAVLADNAVLAAFGTPAVPGMVPPGKEKAAPAAYGLTAYDRADGKLLWEVALPGEPLMDGLSIARDGTTLVRLLDGSLVAVGTPGER